MKGWMGFAAIAWIGTVGMAQQDSVLAAVLTDQLKRRSDTTTARPIERDALTRLYEPIARPRWLAVGGLPTRQALDAIEALASADRHGLPVRTADVALLRALAAASRDSPASGAQFDVALSHSMIRLLADVRMGQLDPTTATGFDPPNAHGNVDLAALVVAVATSGDVTTTIAGIEPRYAGYLALERVLRRYRSLAADTTIRPPRRPTSTIRPGDAYDDVPTLVAFLRALGDLPQDATVANAPAPPTTSYDGALVDALRSFQRRHGLEPDGAIGPATVAALRTPLVHRVRQIELALERWRWLPNVPPARFVAVNIPSFRLYAFENDSTAEHPELISDVIVGQVSGHKTPIFTATLREVVFNPYWDVPTRIARTELVPMFRRRPGSFTSDGFEIVRPTARDAPVTTFAPTPANLDRVVAGELRVRQRPGPANALGLVKFIFPNRHNVFFHDTPTRDLFTRARRDFSHGCIRVARPNELAEFVLRGQGTWGAAAIDSAMHGDRTLHVPLARPLPVFVLYATAEATADGTVSFYPDVYQHDAALERLLGLGQAARR